MAGRLTNINLREWAIAPVQRLATQQATQIMVAGEVLRLTPGAATYNNLLVAGGLPSVAQLNGSPYYHLLLFPWTTGATSVDTDFLTVRVEGNEILPVPVGSDSGDVGAVPYRAVYRIPSAVQSIEIVADAGCSLTYAFAVPRVPLDDFGNRISLLAQQDWNNAAYFTLDGGTVNLADAGSMPLTLPTAAQLGGASYFYLGLSLDLDGIPAADPPVILAYHNQSLVPVDAYLFVSDTNPVIRLAPSEHADYGLPYRDNNPTQPTLRQISAAYTSDIRLVARLSAPATVCTGSYFWVIPVVPESP